MLVFCCVHISSRSRCGSFASLEIFLGFLGLLSGFFQYGEEGSVSSGVVCVGDDKYEVT